MGQVYEVINPSDAVTFEADDERALEVAFLMVCQSAMVGLNRVSDGEVVRGMMAGEDYVNRLFEGYDDAQAYIAANREAMAAAMESVLYGTADDRELFAAMVEGKDAAAVRALREKWNDKKRTSLTDYSGPCLAYADKLRKMHEDADEARG